MGEILALVLRSRRFIVGAVLFLAVLCFGVIGPRVTDRDPFQMVGGLFNPPSDEAVLGTDNLGRDVFTQLMYVPAPLCSSVLWQALWRPASE